MARPSKRTVDYFPHDTDACHRKTLTVLQNRFGNDGYAFWFKLLELLGRSPGHYYCYQTTEDLEFLSAETHQKDTETTLKILAMLDVLGAIDHELYNEKVIWCQRFVDGVAEAYRRAKYGVPQRPDNGVYVSKSGQTASNLPTETPKSDTEMPYIRLDKSILNTEIDIESVINAYQDQILLGGTISEEMRNEVTKACDRYGSQAVIDAMKTCIAEHQPQWRNIMAYLKTGTKEAQ